MNKRLVRIDLDIWRSAEPEVTIRRVVKETKAGVSIETEHEVRYQLRKMRTVGSFPKSSLGKIRGKKPGIKFVSYVTDAEDPQSTETFRLLVLQMTDMIYTELTHAGARLAQIRNGLHERLYMHGANTSAYKSGKDSDRGEQPALQTICGGEHQSVMF